jgi:hypothetical protein
MNKLQDELGITAASFAPTKAVAKRGVAGVTTRAIPVVEKKMARTLLLVLLLFYACIATTTRKDETRSSITTTTITINKRNPRNFKKSRKICHFQH